MELYRLKVGDILSGLATSLIDENVWCVVCAYDFCNQPRGELLVAIALAAKNWQDTTGAVRQPVMSKAPREPVRQP